MMIEHIFRAQVYKVLAQANAMFGTNAVVHGVEFYNRGLAAGKACFKKRSGTVTVKLNREAIEKDVEHLFCNTVPHEVAHVIVRSINKANPFMKPHSSHGRKWRMICMALGGTGERCHNIGLTPARQRRTTRRFNYVLGSGRTVNVTAQMHAKIQTGARYSIRSPKEYIQPWHWDGHRDHSAAKAA